MSVLDKTIDALESDPEIRLLYAELSAGDRSALVALLDCDAGVGATSLGSPNAKFWFCLAEHGWMAPVDSLLPDAPISMLNFCITDTGYRAIPVLLSRLVSDAGI